MYRLIRLTSKPLNKKQYLRTDIKTTSYEDVVLQEKNKNQQEIKEQIQDETRKENVNKIVGEAKAEQLGLYQEVVEKNPKKKKKEKKESKFSIWEEIPDEPRDESQLAAAEIINQDGYYDTIEPIDIKEEHVVANNFNWKIPVVLLSGLILLGLIGFAMFKIYF